jgi:hypothetical protein
MQITRHTADRWFSGRPATAILMPQKCLSNAREGDDAGHIMLLRSINTVNLPGSAHLPPLRRKCERNTTMRAFNLKSYVKKPT